MLIKLGSEPLLSLCAVVLSLSFSVSALLRARAHALVSYLGSGERESTIKEQTSVNTTFHSSVFNLMIPL